MNDVSAIALSTQATRALGLLEAAGFESWCVGGCVRDALLGREVNDFDIATAASWEDTERVLAEGGFAIHRTGTAHGTVTAVLAGEALEITTYRADGAYADGRHPDGVTFVKSIEEDLARRDFTVNALAFHPERGFFDCMGGLDDLQTGVIRAVGDPGKRFSEDGLRILRGCRFASQLGFSIEPETLQAMKASKKMLSCVSAERITHELDGLLLGDHVHDALVECVDVLVGALPEAAACRGFEQHTPYHIYDVWEHTAWVVQRVPATRRVRWAALFHDIGKPAACFFEGDRAHFYGHPEISARLAEAAMKRLLMAPRFMADVLKLVRLHDREISATPRSVRRALASLEGDVELFRDLVSLKRADALAQSELSRPRLRAADDIERILEDLLSADAAFSVKQLAIDGNDVIAHGVPAGPLVGSVLDAALEAVMDEKLANERDALISFIENF